MKLQELAAVKPTRQISKVFESYFGSKMAVEKIPAAHARAMLARVQGVLGETRRQPSFHHSEQNPTYLKLVMMEQALTARLREEEQAQVDAAQAAAKIKDPKLAAKIENAQRMMLSQAAAEAFIESVQVTDADLKKEYDERVGPMKNAEFRAKHILVETEHAAKDIIAAYKKEIGRA